MVDSNRAVVVDDEPLVVTAMSRWLADAGFTVHTAGTFEEGRRLLALDPGLLVADVRLAGFNGLHLAILARHANPAVRIVMISGYDDPVIRREVDAVGGRFLSKPFTPAQLRDAVGAATP